MELNQLKNFQILAQYEHMAEAAEALHVAQPTLSKSISRLEYDLGVKLFDRSGRGLKLNLYGKALLAHIDGMFDELNAGLDEIKKMKDTDSASVSFLVNLPSIIPPLMKSFSGSYNTVNIQAGTGTTQEMLEGLKKGNIDFCISTPPIYGEGMETKLLAEEEIYLAVPSTHPLAKRKSVDLAEAKDESFVAFRKNYAIRSQTDAFCEAAGFSPKIVFEGDAATMSSKLVSMSLGIALIPRSHFWEERSMENIVYIHIDSPRCTRQIGITCRNEKKHHPCVRHFTDYIQKELQKTQNK